MNIQKFIAPSAREALAKARHAFGDATLILSNRTTPQGVEVMATSDQALHALGVATPAQLKHTMNTSVQEDADQLSMSTLSFQDYVRERMLRRRHEAEQAQAGGSPARAETASPARTATPPGPERSSTKAAPSQTAAPGQLAMHTPKPSLSAGIMEELQSVKSLIEHRFDTLQWLGQARQDPVQSSLMLRLLRAGFSPSLSRAMMEKLPPNLQATQAMDWIGQVLERNLKTDVAHSLLERGGTFALVGATGVGKTTTAAKLAAQCAAVHGAAHVGLITLDIEKSGAHEQLRSHGRNMGVVAHLAHDRCALEDLLGLLAGKKMVLIDTAGLAPRDPRRQDVLDMLNLPGIQRLLVLQASGQSETMEETVTSFRTTTTVGSILSKLDETVKLAPALDVLIRHQLPIKGLTTGQRVPEDWEEADKARLVRQALRTPGKSAFDPQLDDLSHLFYPSHVAGDSKRTH